MENPIVWLCLGPFRFENVSVKSFVLHFFFYMPTESHLKIIHSSSAKVTNINLLLLVCEVCVFDVGLLDMVAAFLLTGMLKSIMKRKDGSSSSENRKKSLQFVGILNGGYATILTFYFY